MSSNDRSPLANYVGCRVRVRGALEITTSPMTPFVVGLIQAPLILLSGGGCCTPSHVWVRKAHLLTIYRRGEEITFSARVIVYRRRGDPTPEFGLEDVRDAQSLPLPPALRIRRGAIKP
jgi:hypothetical protein